MSKYKYPPVIYLQRGPAEEITWCSDNINDDDVKYVREEKIDHIQSLIQRLKEDAEFFYQHYRADNKLPVHLDEIAKHQKLMEELK